MRLNFEEKVRSIVKDYPNIVRLIDLSEERICPYCRFQNQPSFKYCENCGSNLN